ncbi:MAG: UDP-glucose/GDP-mannose dehydrogenase family protein [Gammaproteobacteria bacterium]|nr:UDP-glucose/GDP-mannose dehydrogenase family protein [Gammaproteobacteria bacterium]
MNITVVGTGYVGLVTGACLAEMGNSVICVDHDAPKIDGLLAGRLPIFEPGLDDLVGKNTASGQLGFTTDIARGVGHGEVIFIAVGTPPGEDGSADLRHVLAVAQSIGEHIGDYRVVVNKSTVPVGTAQRIEAAIDGALKARGGAVPFSVVANPEFLKQGAAVNDCMKPDRIIIGARDERAMAVMRELYAPFNRNHERVIAMDIASAELTKYAANAMLAARISCMNEMSNLAERLGADIESVRLGIGADPRIGYSFIYPGCGYGGSCLPKDLQALIRTAAEAGYPARILEAVEAVNAGQKRAVVEKIVDHFGADLSGRRFALWGLAFKPGTDDMRAAPSRVVLEMLWERGAAVRAFDPVAGDQARRIYGERSDLELLCADPYEALSGVDGLIVVTEWRMFRAVDPGHIAAAMRGDVVVDGRNIYDPAVMRNAGLVYYGIGRR